MSFRDPFGPFRAESGPDFVHEDPLVYGSFEDQTGNPVLRIRSSRSRLFSVKGGALMAGATAALNVLLFIPIVYLELTSVETVAVHGKSLTGREFADRLQNLFLGTSIVALALTSLVASASFVSGQLVVRPKAMHASEGSEGLGKLVPLKEGKVRHV